MRKHAILVVMMAVIIAVTSSCGLIVKDEAVDAQTVIIEVAGETFVKADVQQAIQNVLDYNEYVYSLYGLSYDRTDADSIAAAQETAINSLVEEAVSSQKIAEYGLDRFLTEELDAITQKAEETYAGYIANVKSAYFADTELTGDELTAAVEAKLLEIGYSSLEALTEQEKKTEELARLKEFVVKDVTVSEDEITTQYNNGIAQQTSTYESDLTQYATDVSNGAIIYFNPHGYRYVKNLLIKISDDYRLQLTTLSSQISSDQSALSSIEESIAELPEDPATDTEDQKKARDEFTAQVDALNAEIADLTAQADELTKEAYGAIQPTVDVVQGKLDAGGSFDALIEAFGEDPGMTAEPQKSQGYLVCEGLTNYVSEFVTQAMTLENIGDISVPFRTVYGVHFLQYASDLDAGKVPLSAIRDQIEEQLLSSKQDDAYATTVTQWVADANAKIYQNRLAN